MTAYYNEIDPYAAQWLRNLIDGGHIARGDVDERSIVDVRADDLRGYSQAHFFAGLGDASQPGRGGHDDCGGVLGGFWAGADWIDCTDGKSRPVGPGSFPLGHGIRNRTSKLRAYGNSIVPQVAAAFIGASMSSHHQGGDK